jgi:uroporphyrinogen-III decarboxylase
MPPVPSKALEALEFKMYKWPGYGLPDDVLSHQYEEDEYMKPDEYDALIEDPTDYWLRTYLPRVFGKLAPLAKLGRFTEIYEIPTRHLAIFGQPDVQDALKALMKAGDEMNAMREKLSGIGAEVAAQGFPGFTGGFAKAPLDIIGDTLRGTMAVMMDLFRRPEKLKAAMERLVPITIKGAVEAANATGCPVIMMPLHKGADGFMSEKQFEKLYWPTLRDVILGMVEEGLLPLLFAEGSYNTRLDVISDLPKGSVTWWFDQTDMARVAQILGGKTCIEGNVPVSLLTSGTPEDVDTYCRNLIETCGKDGGYVLTPGASAENAKPENLKAMVEAPKKYGA